MAAHPITLYERAEAALHDAQLKLALERATTRFTAQRATALALLLDSDEVRDRARAARARALAQLDHYLEQLAANVAARGGQVHWAATAEDARRIILDLCRARGVRRIVKGKSMAAEEIHLNQALEQAGYTVVETDLGEYIIQLAGQTPSHIIAPAIHWTREQVAELFHRKLGAPLTDDIPQLARTARETLRQEYLHADLGITGVNFAVAESGTIVLIENEGNGRLTSGAPRIHLAIMGIERTVATLEDLQPLLQVLARSATGQKLSVYTNFISGPARADEPDGPEEFHLLLLDNGRSRILGSDYVETLYCIRCGACLNICPVYSEIGGHAYGAVYPGPIGAVLTPNLEGLNADTRWLPYASTLCGACQEVCPVRIPLPDYLLKLRRDAVRQVGAPPLERAAMRAWQIGMNAPGLYRTGARAARLGLRLLTRRGRIRRLPPPLNAWTRRRDFPPFAPRSFQERWQARRAREKQ